MVTGSNPSKLSTCHRSTDCTRLATNRLILLDQAATQTSLKPLPEETQALNPIAKETVPITNPALVLPHIQPVIHTALPKGQHYAPPRVQYKIFRGCRCQLYFPSQ